MYYGGCGAGERQEERHKKQEIPARFVVLAFGSVRRLHQFLNLTRKEPLYTLYRDFEGTHPVILSNTLQT